MPIASDGRVPTRRPDVNYHDIQVGDAVRALTQSQLANLAHWVRARGRVLVPEHYCKTKIVSGSPITQRYKVRESGLAIARVWIGRGRVSGSSFGSLTIKASGASASVTSASAYSDGPDGHFVHIEPCSKSSGVTELQITATSTSVVGDELTSVGCWELPRAALARGGTDLGLALDSYGPRRPFFEDASAGPKALATLTAACTTKRGTLVAGWCEAGFGTTSAAFTDMLVAGIPLTPSKDKASDTTRTCTIDIYAYVTAGATTGEVRVKDAAGATSSAMTVTSTTPAWIGTVTKSFTCEDLSTADGLPGSGEDTVQISVRRTAGAGTPLVKGWVVYE